MHCQGKSIDKAEELFNVLQEGGKEVNKDISAGDKDVPINITKICAFCT